VVRTAASDSPPAITLEVSDLALLRFAAEHRFVLAAQGARLLARPVPSIQRSLRRLRAAGLVRTERMLRHEPTAYRVTRAGLTAAGSELRPSPALDLAAYRHDVGLAWLDVAARRGLFGEVTEVVAEKRMRSEDRRDDRPEAAPRHGVPLGVRQGPRSHYPDLVLVTGSGHRVAFELELSTKAPARRERILAAYAADPRIDAVVYLVPTRAAGDAISRSAARAGAGDKVAVRRFAWAGGRAPGQPAAQTVRRRTGARGRAAETKAER
jgi:DNA-binding PadR family transcriptional regulator